MVRPKKYRKSWRQRKKEEARRKTLFELLTADSDYRIYKRVLVEKLGVSRATVYCDLKKLKRRLNRWELDQKIKRLIEYKRSIEAMSDAEFIDRYLRMGSLLALFLAGKLFKLVKGRPRGKPFTSEYQPRWRK